VAVESSYSHYTSFFFGQRTAQGHQKKIKQIESYFWIKAKGKLLYFVDNKHEKTTDARLHVFCQQNTTT